VGIIAIGVSFVVRMVAGEDTSSDRKKLIRKKLFRDIEPLYHIRGGRGFMRTGLVSKKNPLQVQGSRGKTPHQEKRSKRSQGRRKKGEVLKRRRFGTLKGDPADRTGTGVEG